MEINAESKNCPVGASTYVWRYGDTLTSVARSYNTTEQAIIHINPALDFHYIQPGMEICLPPRTLTCPNGILYTVQAGDTLTSIAYRFSVTTLSLIDQNPYTDPNTLRAGQILCIPAREVPLPTPRPTTPPAYPCPSGYISGVVNYGQTLLDILEHYNISYQAFQLANRNLNLERLMPGQRYCIPPIESRGLCEGGGRSYVIADGETLDSVAAQFGISQATLLRLNPALAPEDFIPGRTICIGNR